jgi:beta-lactamase regulating signal transducer with metallopeptidase domain
VRIAKTVLLVVIFQLGRLHDTLSPHAYLWLLTGLAVLCAAVTVRQPDHDAL